MFYTHDIIETKMGVHVHKFWRSLPHSNSSLLAHSISVYYIPFSENYNFVVRTKTTLIQCLYERQIKAMQTLE